MLPQRPGDLFVHESVGEELSGGDGSEALRRFGLDDMTESDPRDLSGGERQRLALAIVVAGRDTADGDLPGALLLDEPTRGMDRARKGELAELARELSDRGAAVMIATHDVEFAATFADRVILLARGEVAADGTARELLSGGWYFSSEVARILDGAAVTVEEGVSALGAEWTAPAAPQRPPPEGPDELGGGRHGDAGADAARRLRLVRALAAAFADRRSGRGAGGDLGRGAGRLLADPERGPDHRHHADRRLRPRPCPGVRGRCALWARLQFLARAGAVDSLADGGLGADRDSRRRRRGGEPARIGRFALAAVCAFPASPTGPCSTSR